MGLDRLSEDFVIHQSITSINDREICQKVFLNNKYKVISMFETNIYVPVLLSKKEKQYYFEFLTPDLFGVIESELKNPFGRNYQIISGINNSCGEILLISKSENYIGTIYKNFLKNLMEKVIDEESRKQVNKIIYNKFKEHVDIIMEW